MATKKPAPLSQLDELFCLTYLKNGENAKRAYMETHPRAQERTAEVEGSKLLRKPEVAAFIDKEREARKKRLRMDGDEALEAITRIARGFPRSALYENNRLKPIDQWPDEAFDCVKSIKPTPFGTAVTFHDKLRARELMAVAGGKLRTKVDHLHAFDHAAYLGAEPPEGDDE